MPGPAQVGGCERVTGKSTLGMVANTDWEAALTWSIMVPKSLTFSNESRAIVSSIKSGNFTFTTTSIPDVIVVDTDLHGDERGFFMETYKRPDFVAGGIDAEFVQDNRSSSARGVLRGLHFQIEHPQAKLVGVVRGSVFDVCVDLREGSPTWGRWEGAVLSAENHRQLFIPRGFAHGFLVLSRGGAEFAYKCDDVWYPNDEGGIMWSDPQIGIEWPALEGDDAFDPTKVILSERDRRHPPLREL